MNLIALGWDLPPGFTHPIKSILASVFRSPCEPAIDIEALVADLDRAGDRRTAA